MPTASVDLLCTFTEGTSNKFWRAEVFAGDVLYVTYGRIGGTAQTQAKRLSSQAAAAREARKKYQEKIDKGYVPVQAESKGRYPTAADLLPASPVPSDGPDVNTRMSQLSAAFAGMRVSDSRTPETAAVSIRTLDLDD